MLRAPFFRPLIVSRMDPVYGVSCIQWNGCVRCLAVVCLFICLFVCNHMNTLKRIFFLLSTQLQFYNGNIYQLVRNDLRLRKDYFIFSICILRVFVE